jgi:hypothetical protein
MINGAWTVDLDAEVKCGCHYYNKFGYCVHYVAFCDFINAPYLGRNIRAEKLFDPRKKTNRVKARNVKKGKSTNKEDKEDSSEDDYGAGRRE